MSRTKGQILRWKPVARGFRSGAHFSALGKALMEGGQLWNPWDFLVKLRADQQPYMRSLRLLKVPELLLRQEVILSEL